MRYSRRIVLALTLVFALAQVAAAQVLDQVPDGALVVVKVKNLAATNTKLGAFFKDLGVDQLDPDLADPLAAVKKNLNISQGLDESGDIAFIYVDPDSSGADKDHSMLILVPVSDYKAFTGNFPDGKTEGDFTQVKLGHAGDDSYITQWGKFAAISPSKDLLLKKPTAGVKLVGLTAKELNDKDAIVYCNMAIARKMALPEIQSHRDEWLTDATRNLEGDKAKFAPVVKALFGQVLNVAEGYLKDSNSATYGISFGKNGINGTLMTEFDTGTYSGDLVKMVKNSDDKLLTGLPNSSYIFYGGAVTSPEVSLKIINDFTAPISKELTALGDDGKPMLDYIDSVKKLVSATKSGSFGMLTPPGMIGQSSIFQFVETMTGDSKAIALAQKNMAANQQEFMQMISPETAAAQKVTYTLGAKTIDGVTLDQMQTEFNGAANNPQAAQVQQMMKMVYGPDGAKMLSGSIDADTRIFAIGVGDDVIQQLITSVKTKDDALAKSEGVSLVTDELPKNRVFVGYYAIDNLATAALKYAAAFGMALPVNIPPNQPPVGVSVATEGTAVRMDTFIPTKLVKSITAAVIQFQMMMNGGGQGGGNGPQGGGM